MAWQRSFDLLPSLFCFVYLTHILLFPAHIRYDKQSLEYLESSIEYLNASSRPGIRRIGFTLYHGYLWYNVLMQSFDSSGDVPISFITDLRISFPSFFPLKAAFPVSYQTGYTAFSALLSIRSFYKDYLTNKTSESKNHIIEDDGGFILPRRVSLHCPVEPLYQFCDGYSI